MSFVGTRPEAVKYVEKYKPEYMATLLLPAGITSEAINAMGITKAIEEKVAVAKSRMSGMLDIKNITRKKQLKY